MTDSSRARDEHNLVDSAYGSFTTSPNDKDPSNRESSQDANSQRCPVPSRASTSSILGGLNRFEKDPDPAALDRFKDVVERVQDPLIHYLRKRYGPRDFQPMAIRLMMLGKTYEDAKPHIVVFSPEKAIKRVKKFFAQRSIASVCCPNDSSQFSFEITFVGRPPRPKYASTIEVYGASNLPTCMGWKSSSTLIKVTHDSRERYATMGGVIKIVKSDGDFVLCGLTVGHILEQEEEECAHDDNSALRRLSTSSDMSSEEGSDGEEDILDVDEAASPTHGLSATCLPASTGYDFSWVQVGNITTSDRPVEARNRDWALVEDIHKRIQRPNMIQKRSADLTQQPARQLTLMKDQEFTGRPSHRALVIAGSLHGSGSHAGLLSNLPTMALLPSGTRFVPVYTITLDGATGLWSQ